MIVMPANNTKAFDLDRDYPGRIGWLLGPGGWKDPRHLSFGLDNGQYAVWRDAGFDSEGAEAGFREADYERFLDRVQASGKQPRWAVVPDVPGSRDRTLRFWDQYAPRLEARRLRLAFACQDDMTPRDVPAGAVAFLGGTMPWKRRVLEAFAAECERLHVARVNTFDLLWDCDDCGVESCDGTGWFRGDQRQLRRLRAYLDSATNGGRHPQPRLFHDMIERWRGLANHNSIDGFGPARVLRDCAEDLEELVTG